MLLRVLYAVSFLLLSNIALAGFKTGNDIFEECNLTQGHAYVANYAMGVADTYALLMPRAKLLPICIPNGVSARQLTDVFCQYLREKPASRNEDASGLAAVSFFEAWPCTNQ